MGPRLNRRVKTFWLYQWSFLIMGLFVFFLTMAVIFIKITGTQQKYFLFCGQAGEYLDTKLRMIRTSRSRDIVFTRNHNF